jgi:hypothetical protein
MKPSFKSGYFAIAGGPSVRLLLQLKSAVEITYPRDAAPQTAQ